MDFGLARCGYYLTPTPPHPHPQLSQFEGTRDGPLHGPLNDMRACCLIQIAGKMRDSLVDTLARRMRHWDNPLLTLLARDDTRKAEAMLCSYARLL